MQTQRGRSSHNPGYRACPLPAGHCPTLNLCPVLVPHPHPGLVTLPTPEALFCNPPELEPGRALLGPTSPVPLGTKLLAGPALHGTPPCLQTLPN